MLEEMHESGHVIVADADSDPYDALDPYGDHPEAVEALRAARHAETRAMDMPEGMTGLEAPMGVIGG